MPQPFQDSLRQSLAELKNRVAKDPALAREVQEAQLEFHQGGPARYLSPGPAAENRFLEWFLFDRPSQRYGAPPATTLQENVADQVFGVFEVTGMVPSRELAIRDLWTGRDYTLDEAEGSSKARIGDLLIGRVFWTGNELHILSQDSATLLRGEGLLEAMRQDLGRIKAESPAGSRISALQIERLFRIQPQGEEMPLEEIEHRWGTLVGESNPSFAFVRIRQRLEKAGSKGSEATEIMNELAMETKADLEQARSLLLNLIASRQPRPEEKPRTTEEALEEFRQSKARGEDMETRYRNLEKAMGLDEVEEEDGGELPTEPELTPLAQEFVWEMTQKKEKGNWQPVLDLARFAEETLQPPIAFLADLKITHMVRFLILNPHCQKNVEETMGVLGKFCGWADAEQGTQLLEEFRKVRSKIGPTLERIAQANACIKTNPGTQKRPAFYRVASIEKNEVVLQPIKGTGTRKVRWNHKVIENTRTGDIALWEDDLKRILPEFAESFLD